MRKFLLLTMAIFVMVPAGLAQTTLWSCDFSADDCSAIYEDDGAGSSWTRSTSHACADSCMYHSYDGSHSDDDFVVFGPFTVPSASFMTLDYSLGISSYNDQITVYTICDTYADPNTSLASWTLLEGPLTTAQDCTAHSDDLSGLLSCTQFWIAWRYEGLNLWWAMIDDISITYGSGPTATPTDTPVPTSTPTPMPGDDCSDPIVINCGDCVQGSTVGYSNARGDTAGCAGAYGGPDVVYELTLTQTTTVTVVGESDFDSDWAMSSTCDDSCDVFGVDRSASHVDPSCGSIANDSWGYCNETHTLAAGTYYIWVDGYSGSYQGNYALEVTCSTAPTATPTPSPTAAYCCNTTVNTYPYSEGFETDLGYWQQNANQDDIDWTRQTGSTPSTDTGPTAAYEGSYYVFTESSSQSNMRAILDGVCFDLTPLTNPQFRFAYHMYGATMGTLSVDASTDSCVTWTQIWTRSGDLGNQWRMAYIDLSAFAGSTVSLRFNGFTGTSYTSDMAIDAIELGEAVIPPTPTITPTPTPVPTIPPNDDCANAIALTLPASFSVDNDVATADGTGSCGSANPLQNSVWYTYTATTACQLSIVVDSPSYDGVVILFSGSDCASLTEVQCIDDPEPQTFSVLTTPGTTYWIAIGDYGSTEGGGLTNVTVDCTVPPTPTNSPTPCPPITIPYAEGFEAGVPPACWSVTSLQPGTDAEWSVGTYSPHEGTNKAHSRYPNNANPVDEQLITGVMDFSGATDAYVSFWWNTSYYWFVSPYDNGDFDFDVSTDGGANWTTLWTEQNEGTFDSWTWYQEQIPLTAYAGMSNVMFRFRVVGADAAEASVDQVEFFDQTMPTPLPTSTPTNTPTATPTSLPDDYAALCIRTVDIASGTNADTMVATTASTYDIYVTIKNVGQNDNGFTITVTDPALPSWSSTVTVLAGSLAAGTCAEFQPTTPWPNGLTPTVCGNHQLIATLSSDDNTADNVVTKSIEIPNTLGQVIVANDSWTTGGSIGNASYYSNGHYYTAVEFTALGDATINYIMAGVLNSLNNSWGTTFPDGTADQFGLVFLRDNGGQPANTAEVTEFNLYPQLDASGHLDVIETYWVPQCSITVYAGEKFYIGFRNIVECGSGYEALCQDADGQQHATWEYIDGAWSQNTANTGDPIIHVGLTYNGATATPTPTVTPYPFCATGDQYSDAPAAAITDNNCPTTDDHTITATTAGVIDKVTVRVDITHTWDSDLELYLTDPSGSTTVTLCADVGSSGDDFTQTFFDDGASVAIDDGTAPFTGRYRPQGNLSDFIGLEASGDWTLGVCDGASGDTGTLNSWDLCIESHPAAPTATPTPMGPVPATGPVGLGLLILALSAILGVSKFRK